MSSIQIISQEDVEKAMAEAGYQSYLQQNEGPASSTMHGQALLRSTIDNVEAALRSWLKGKGAKHSRAGRLLKQVPLDVVAFLACRVVLDKCTEGDVAERTLARLIGNAVEDEAQLRLFRREFADEWRKLGRILKAQHATTKHKRKVYRAAANRARGTWESWSRSDKAHVGVLMIDFVLTETGLIHREVITKRYKKQLIKESLIKPDPSVADWLKTAKERFALALPTYLPCVSPPLDWHTNFDGGYHGFSSKRSGLMRYQRPLRHLAPMMTRNACPIIFDAVNAAQATGFRVDEDVIQVSTYFWDLGSQIADLPSQEDYNIPDVPLDIDDDPKVKAAWKREAHRIYNLNAQLLGKKLRTTKILTTAQTFADRPIYYPKKLDFRTRMYDAPGYLEPQGDDLAKGHLIFDRALPRDEGWLSIHGSGVYGDDKGSVEERRSWASENRKAILEVAENPLDNRWWAEADKPWQFLQFCLDYARVDGLSSISCAMDGSNNGLQILSLINRDPEGAAATNVMWTGGRRDIYQDVADRAVSKLKVLARTEPWAGAWLTKLGAKGIDRKATKRPVMTTPYGVKLPTARDYFRDWCAEQPWWEYDPKSLVVQSIFDVADLIWDSIRETVPKAIEVMDWLQRIADKACDLNKPIIWKTPLGATVGQLYRQPRKEQIRTTLRDGIRRKHTVYSDGEKPARMKMKDGISPNFVHSLDASAMFLTIHKATALGIRDFAMIHDSFGTHSHNGDVLARCTREAYAEIFSGNLLVDFWRQQQENLGVSLPAPPDQGDLDPREVLASPHFFL